jgi:cephalosporin hydroxylase
VAQRTHVLGVTENLGQWYRRVAADPSSDIAPHFSRMMRLVADHDVRTVVELGVREGHSTAAWLSFLPADGQVYGVDLVWLLPPRARLNPIVGDDLDPAVVAQVPERIDLLFVDSSHDYEHTRAELALYGPRVRPGGLVVLHDTANEHPEEFEPAIGPQDAFPVRRAMVEYAEERSYTYDDDPCSYGLGVIYVA